MGLIARVSKSAVQSAPIYTGAEWLAPPAPQPFTELGVTGLLRTKGTGYVYDEWLASLSAYRQRQVYREMRDNDAIIGSMFFALEMILRRVEWRVEAGRGSKAKDYALFFKDSLDDMSETWSDIVAEACSMFAFGFAAFETVYKRRKGPRRKGTASSQFNDGLIGWRKIAPRAQESILYWNWDDDGDLEGLVQLAAPDWQTIAIPAESLLLFRTTSLKNNPEGRSCLRNCYRSYTLKKRLEEVAGIGIERDICGMPVLYATKAAEKEAGGREALRRLVRSVRIDDQMGIVLPQAYDEKGNPAIRLELVKSAGSKNTDIEARLRQLDTNILSTMLAGFIQYGSTEHGSRALHLSATQIFAEAVGAYLDSFAATFNRDAIPRCMALNGMDLDQKPKLVPGDIGVRDLEEIGNYVQKLALAGIPLIDAATVSHLRKLGKFPEQPAGDRYDVAINGNLDELEPPPSDTAAWEPGRRVAPAATEGNQGSAGAVLEAASSTQE